MTEAERAARYRKQKAERAAQQHQLGAEALAFLLTIEEAETYSMTHPHRRVLKDIQMRGRLARLDAEPA